MSKSEQTDNKMVEKDRSGGIDCSLIEWRVCGTNVIQVIIILV